MAQYDVVTIGNAIVDVASRMDEDFLINNGIIKGAMNLIDAPRAEYLYNLMGPAIEMSGGSAANTAAGIANFGGKAAFMGKVAADHLGQVFAHDLSSQNVAYDTAFLENGDPTARCIIFTTPDGERSMNTYLGACEDFGPEDIDPTTIANAKLIYFEGYLWDPPRAKEAMRLASKISHQHGRQVAITLSDSFCVDRYREEFLDLIRSGVVDIVFANDAELRSLYLTSSLDEAVNALRDDVNLFGCVTRAELGSMVVTREETFAVNAIPVERIVDTTGAGDLYAAGFLYGYTHNYSLHDSARLGTLAGSIIVQQVGPRTQFSLRERAQQAGLLVGEDNKP